MQRSLSLALICLLLDLKKKTLENNFFMFIFITKEIFYHCFISMNYRTFKEIKINHNFTRENYFCNFITFALVF